ncbi:MAG: CBS domain-containing protein [Proteobacteria bacterium]|nr:CBS domain-containing protein [Pseudomonadota bacterium]
MRVDVILRHKGNDVFSISPERTVQEAANLLTKNKIGALLVRDQDGAILGVLSERDVLGGIAANKGHVLSKPVSALMTSRIVTCSPLDTLDDIMDVMTNKRIRHIPVMEDGELKGIVSIGDVVKHRMSEIETESDALRQYISVG